jgi:hypothetical protein
VTDRLPPAARAISAAATEAVEAAQATAPAHDQPEQTRAEEPATQLPDRARYEAAAERLAALDPHQTGLVLGETVRLLLEHLHPDGLDADDLRAVLERVVRGAVPWLPTVDPDVFVVLLTGALGVHPDAEEVAPPGPAQTARHAPLLVADLLAVSGQPLSPVLAAAFAEIAQRQAMESA